MAAYQIVGNTKHAKPSSTHATYSTRSSSLPLLTVWNPSTVFARRAFNYTSPTTWNSLPADILTWDSESGFKRLLKTHLFNNCLTSPDWLISSTSVALPMALYKYVYDNDYENRYLLNFLKIQFWVRVYPVCQLNDKIELQPKSASSTKQLSTCQQRRRRR